MSVNGDVSEQVVRLSLEGFEVLARLTGSGAKNVAAMIYTIMKDQQQTKGKTKLNNMLKTGKPLKIFTIKKEDLKTFSKESKNYGITFCALMNKNIKEVKRIWCVERETDDSYEDVFRGTIRECFEFLQNNSIESLHYFDYTKKDGFVEVVLGENFGRIKNIRFF